MARSSFRPVPPSAENQSTSSTVAADQDLVKIPVRRSEGPRLGRGPAVERMRAGAGDDLLVGQGKGDIEGRLAEATDLVVAAGLLAAEIVRRDSQHDEALVLVTTPQGFQAAILVGEAAAGRRVDQQDHAARVVGGRHRSAADRVEGHSRPIDRLATGLSAGTARRRRHGAESGKQRQAHDLYHQRILTALSERRKSGSTRSDGHPLASGRRRERCRLCP